MQKEDVEKWLKYTEEAGYIDCSQAFELFEDGEYSFILNMAKELLERM